ncbi:MAG: hypothetical protein ACK4FP_11055 [Azonexus sp.]
MTHHATHAFVLGGLLVAGLAGAAPQPIPFAVAESDSFEAVGRLEAEGFSWYIDRADSNAPVLAARLEVEANGQAVSAVFRPERGDYLINDAAWLAPLRQPGEHLLALTLIAGDESDLLSAELHVDSPPDEAAGSVPAMSVGGAGALAGLGGLYWLWRRRVKGGRA